ncbi:MAG: hydroxymethylglutaryl-CoA reductase, degradative [Anaerolineales bacterium]
MNSGKGQSSSRISNFYNLGLEERQSRLVEAAGHPLDGLMGPEGLDLSLADSMIENVVGLHSLPLGIATNFVVNGRDVLVPMAIEEPSVVAGASYMAKLVRESGGFVAEADPSHMIGQVQVLDLEDLPKAKETLLQAETQLLEAADEAGPMMVAVGGGARAIEVKTFTESPAGPMLVFYLIYDTVDAMGANSVNTVLEGIAPIIEALTGGRTHLRILSNLADRRLTKASCSLSPETLAFADFKGEEVRDGVIEAWAFAAVDPYRAATHNKGIMNGVDAVVIATGNDWRAVEAGAHAYAARGGAYTPLSRWWVGEEGVLKGELEMPLALGTIGGATGVHPGARDALALMGVERAQDLAQIVVSVGLAQNLAALRALATEGIQRGHMGLHARQLAIAAGARGSQIDEVAGAMTEEENILLERAEELLKQLSDG